MSNRRDFLKTSGLIAAGMSMPQLLKAQTTPYKGRVLVVVQLFGGNDGLNSIVPYTNDTYYRLRPQIGLRKQEIIPCGTDIAFNRSLSGINDMYLSGEACLINNVGYPQPNHSHFRSLEIWQTASDANTYLDTGWLGRYADAMGKKASPGTLIEIDDALSLALKGEHIKGMAFRDAEMLYQAAQTVEKRGIVRKNTPHHEHPTLSFLHQTLADTVEQAEVIHRQTRVFRSRVTYPDNDFGRRMKTIAELICSGLETPVYYVSLSGFDTHAFQKGIQNRLLKVYNDALLAFAHDLRLNNRWKETVVMTFSEFGRRVKQNGSNGTDHGTANNIYLLGGNIRKIGFYNEMPNLDQLSDGDLEHTIDFRQVYATLLEQWLQQDSNSILGKQYPILNIF